jgi:hypothetical protein
MYDEYGTKLLIVHECTCITDVQQIADLWNKMNAQSKYQKIIPPEP